MKKNIAVLVSLFLALSFCGCGFQNAGNDISSDDQSSFPQLTSEDYDLSRYDEGNTKYFDCHGNTWSLTEDSAAKYPKLVSPLKKIDDKEKKFFKESLDSYDKEAKEFTSENNGACYECYADTGISCADPNVVSLVKTQLTFFGGAHPDTVTTAYNIDAKTGKIILLSDIINDKKGLELILAEELMKQYGDHQFFGLEKTLDTLEMNVSPFDEKNLNPQYVYSFNPNGLTFYFNPAVLSPYSDGGEQIDLTFDDLSSVLNKKYTAY